MFDLMKFIFRSVKVSPDLAPSDFHLFSHLKKFLAGQQFASDDEIKVNVQNWFRSQVAKFYEADSFISKSDTLKVTDVEESVSERVYKSVLEH
ncbi:hypothetical protein AVEN_63150-1 [Araneus ventricosus]|uniref:Uncharacterized protein n=1 Tax=Araneus ventricosus TaxID=182803 RepID=A0A4Y2B0F0_ARAVE|nr:hypothetical protein AVEN_63150-1 [Araneus ventricosus]